jgi:predicted secreted protein
MTNAISAFGTLLKIGDGASPEVFTTIAEVKDVSGPALNSRTTEVTSHGSPHAVVEKIITLLEIGNITFDLNWVPGGVTHLQLITDWYAKTKRNFQVVFPDAGSFTILFPAAISFEPTAPVEGALTASVTLEVLGDITTTP